MMALDHARLKNPTGTVVTITPVAGGLLRRSPIAPAPADFAPPIVDDVLHSPGQPLDGAARGLMESRFGRDFTRVRVHADAAAAESARVVNAHAYTVGSDIVFAAGRYSPQTDAGRRLLAHELTHVVQQRMASSPDRGQLAIGDADAPEEQAADQAARSLFETTPGSVPSRIGSLYRPLVQRQCLSGSVCANPIHGAPGQFVAQSESAQEGAQQARARQATEHPEEVQRSGHGSRAVSLERIARDEHLPLDRVHGIFVDLDISPQYGAVTRLCNQFQGWSPPYSGGPNLRCVFYPQATETNARTYLTDPGATTLDGRSRELWRAQTLQTLRHELQHVIFNEASPGRAGAPSGQCTRSTAIFTSGSTVYTLDFHLSEFSAIISEFPPLFHAVPPDAPADHPMAVALNAWFDYKVDTGGESIRGILTALRCRCNCEDVNFYIRDTFNFTAAGWTPEERAAFNTRMRARPNLDWPIILPPIVMPRMREVYSPHSMVPVLRPQ
jgi:hypothetical protein